MNPEDIEGFEIEYRDYTSFRDQRYILVKKVPYLRDPKTNELYLHASTAEQLWHLTHSDNVPKHEVITDVIEFFESELTHA